MIETDAPRRRIAMPILALWVASRLLIVAVAVGAHLWWFSRDLTPDSLFRMWDLFESPWYADIARNGYVGNGDFRYNTAYFPGTALVMRVGLPLDLDPALTGMIAAFIAGGFAAVALGRLIVLVGGAPLWGVTAWLMAPTVVFVTAPWSEALFAATAFWAWYLAKRNHWWWAGALAGLAALTRVNGIFLGVGLIVMWFATRPRRPGNLVPLAIPFVVTFGFFAYLWSITGRWNEWRAVQSEFWGREFVDPLTSLLNTWDLITTFVPGMLSTRFIAELLGAAIICVVLVLIIAKRWWPEATYVALTLASLTTSTFYYSIPRALTILFPVWMMLAVVFASRPWTRWAYVACALPLTFLVIVRFTDGQWIS